VGSDLGNLLLRSAALTVLCAVACSHQQIKPEPFRPISSETMARISEAPPPPAEVSPLAVPAKKKSPATIARAGKRPLDPAAHGEPLAWPTLGVLISGFGERERDKHEGIDLASPEGTPVRAADEGTVLFAGEQKGYGNLVLVAHAGDLVTVYAHNSENLVKKGAKVSRGQQIARVGHTGNATGPHLHFEVRVGARPRDPLGFLR
jgi:lipoprotein NlpD